jgi:hypothetical protein
LSMHNDWISRARGALAGVIVVGGMLCLPPKSAAEEVIVRVAPPAVRGTIMRTGFLVTGSTGWRVVLG